MTEERVSPLRQRMMEDMRIRGMGDKAQKAHIRAIKDFSAFLGHSPDTATPEELRAYQLHMTDTGVTPSTFNARIVALRFFFGMTCGREEPKRSAGMWPVAPNAATITSLIIPARTGTAQSVRDPPRVTGWRPAPRTCCRWSISTSSSRCPPRSRRSPIGTKRRSMACCSGLRRKQ